MILVSACLLGVECRYDGEDSRNEIVLQYLKNTDECAIPVCPEQLGGLPTPRKPTHLSSDGRKVIEGKGKAIMKGGKDVTSQFIKGAEETSRIADLFGAEKAILKSGSPSCGKGKFPKDLDEKSEGMGVTAALLDKKGLKIIRGEDI